MVKIFPRVAGLLWRHDISSHPTVVETSKNIDFSGCQACCGLFKQAGPVMLMQEKMAQSTNEVTWFLTPSDLFAGAFCKDRFF
eukprot:141666-Amphidinium_carterae.1